MYSFVHLFFSTFTGSSTTFCTFFSILFEYVKPDDSFCYCKF